VFVFDVTCRTFGSVEEVLAMRKFLLVLAVLVCLTVFATPAQAQCGSGYGYAGAGYGGSGYYASSPGLVQPSYQGSYGGYPGSYGGYYSGYPGYYRSPAYYGGYRYGGYRYGGYGGYRDGGYRR